MTVSYHIKIADFKRVKKGLYVIYNAAEIAKRTFDHKGITIIPIHMRTAQAEEIHVKYTPYWRIRFIHYSTFEGLWNDELKYTHDPEHFKKLLEIRQRYRWCFSDHHFIPDEIPFCQNPEIKNQQKLINQ